MQFGIDGVAYELNELYERNELYELNAPARARGSNNGIYPLEPI